MKRRKFIKLTGAVAGGAVASPVLLTGCGSAPPAPGSGEVKATPTVCAICFWKCAGFVHTEDSKPWKIIGNPQDLGMTPQQAHDEHGQQDDGDALDDHEHQHDGTSGRFIRWRCGSRAEGWRCRVPR